MRTARHAGEGNTLRFLCSIVLATLTHSSLVGAGETLEGPPCDEASCKKSYAVPMVRVAAVELGMHAGLLLIWSDVFSPADVDGNRDQFKKSWTSFPEYRHGANIFASDGDWWYFNAVLHGLFGSEAYLAARGWRHSPMVSFIYAAAAAFTWEYLVEAWYKRPSAIDLFWTPAGGALLGELRYQLYLLAKHRIAARVPRVLMMSLLDPLGELERLILGCEI